MVIFYTEIIIMKMRSLILGMNQNIRLRTLQFIIQESIISQEREIPEYLEVDIKEFKGRFLRAPLIHDVPYPVTMEPNLVIEYYSR